jgi:hypothetical protein
LLPTISPPINTFQGWKAKVANPLAQNRIGANFTVMSEVALGIRPEEILEQKK